MKVFALASLAALSQALKIREDYWDCYGDWIWEECSGFYYQETLCDVEGENDGWWYSPDADEDGVDDFFVTADEFATWEECWVEEEWYADNWCENEWFETSIGNWWRDPCDGEGATHCGWVYWGGEDEPDYWWSCEEHDEWMANN